MSDQPKDQQASKGSARAGTIITVFKAVAGVSLLGFLLWRAQQAEAFDDLVQQPKNWALLGLALVLTLTSVLVSFIRWFVVARAAGIDIHLGEALRVGAIGYALNFVGPGAVGGDFFKALLVARHRQGRRTAVVTTIIVDRALGLVTMLMVASGGVLLMQAAGTPLSPAIEVTCRMTLAITGGMMLGGLLLLIPGLAGPKLAELVARLPVVGDMLSQVVEAWNEYRGRLGLLGIATAMCFVVDLLLVSSFYCVGQGLPFQTPSFAKHLFLVPLQLTAGAIPITPGGVGVREAAADFFFQEFGIAAGQGTLIALGHSLTMLTAGGVAILYYLSRRSRVTKNLAEAEIEAETELYPATSAAS